MKRQLFSAGAALAFFAAAAGVTDEEGCIREWTLSGPWPSYPQEDGTGSGLDYDPVREAVIRPYPKKKETAVFAADTGKIIAEIGAVNPWGYTDTRRFPANWQLLDNAPKIVKLDKKFLPIDDHFFAYAACYVSSPETQEIQIWVGSDDDHKVILNGREIGRQPSSQGILPGNFRWKGKLHRGVNLLLFKVVDRTAGCGFCVQLMDKKGKPLAGLTTSPDHPGRKSGARCWDNQYGATFDTGKATLLAGKRKVKVRFIAPDKQPVELQLGNEKWSSSGNSVNTVEYPFVSGEQEVALKVFRDGKLVAELVDFLTAHDPEALREENRLLAEKLQAVKKTLPVIAAEKKKLESELAAAKKSLAASYTALEKHYSAQRAAAIAGAPKSLNQPLPAVKTVRKRLCLNGVWEGSADGKTWSPFRLPEAMTGQYFIYRSQPLRPENPKKRYGKVIPLPGYRMEDGNLLVAAKSLKVRTTVNGDFDGQHATLVLESVRGLLDTALNGKKMKRYSGEIGIAGIPLVLKKGGNLLELAIRPNKQPIDRGSWGICGDVYLDYHAPVQISDNWVKTSWRKGMLTVETELENRTKTAFNGRLVQYVIDDRHLQLRLPELSVKVGRQPVTVKNASRWADPKLWNVGSPNLYYLVSELYDGEKLVDRRLQEFGFREYWIQSTSFYANGKRTFLYGDTGGFSVDVPVKREIGWNLLRKDGINLIRTHDASWYYPGAATAADRCGMYMHVQMYPQLYPAGTKIDKRGKHRYLVPLEEFRKTKIYRDSQRDYLRWHKAFRNHPSVFIWSTDNEIGSQSKDHAARAEQTVRDEKIAASYGEYLKSLDPELIYTRDGDLGTWSSRARWFQNPPCDTANYHYPDFNIGQRVIDWQEVYDYRPVVFGETLYCHYQTFYGYVGAIPTQVQKTAKNVAEVIRLYRELEVPAPVFMGPAHDSFTLYDDSGKGNPWGIRSSSMENYAKTGVLPEVGTGYFFRINWPSGSGLGLRPKFHRFNPKFRGHTAVNWFDPKYPSHVRNAVNDAYGKNLPQQPPLVAQTGSCLVRTAPDTPVWSIGATGECYGVRSDAQGWAWFTLPHAGKYRFSDGKNERTFEVPTENFDRPGFDEIKRFTLE